MADIQTLTNTINQLDDPLWLSFIETKQIYHDSRITDGTETTRKDFKPVYKATAHWNP